MLALKEITVACRWMSPERDRTNWPSRSWHLRRWALSADWGLRRHPDHAWYSWYNPYLWVQVLGFNIGAGLLVSEPVTLTDLKRLDYLQSERGRSILLGDRKAVALYDRRIAAVRAHLLRAKKV